MASTDPQMSKQGTGFKRKHGTLSAHKLQIIRRLKSGENQREVIALYNVAIVNMLRYKEKGPITIGYGIK